MDHNPGIQTSGTEVIQTVERTNRRGAVEFCQDVFSDSGEPSSSRILTFILSLTVTGIVIGLFHHLCGVKDNVTLGLWLSALPYIIAALVGLMAAPYAINRAGNTFSDVASVFKK